jgi:transketolase
LDLALLKNKSLEIRREIMKSIANVTIGHTGGSLSIADILSVLYFHAMDVDPADPHKPDRDRLVISKGHAGPALYAALAVKGYFPREDLRNLNRFEGGCPSHCDMNKVKGVDMTAGSLGQGFSCAVGMALGSRVRRDGATIYSIIGDGESQEGQIWEAAMYAAAQRLDNLIAFTDYNGMQGDGTVEEVCSLGNLTAKWRAFGWQTVEVDGHDHAAIVKAIDDAKQVKGLPAMLICRTVKGKGVGYVELSGVLSHSTTVSPDQLAAAIAELQEG